MLTPQERNKAIELLIQVSQNSFQYNYQEAQSILRNGFAGYGTFTDGQLMRALSSLAKNGNGTAQEFISTIAAEKFILE